MLWRTGRIQPRRNLVRGTHFRGTVVMTSGDGCRWMRILIWSAAVTAVSEQVVYVPRSRRGPEAKRTPEHLQGTRHCVKFVGPMVHDKPKEVFRAHCHPPPEPPPPHPAQRVIFTSPLWAPLHGEQLSLHKPRRLRSRLYIKFELAALQTRCTYEGQPSAK